MNFLRISSLVCLLTLTACMASNPMGFSDEEWAALSPEQKYEARLKQNEIDEQKREERAREKALEEDKEREHQERMALRYQNAQYGDIVQCIMKRGVVDYSSGWNDAEPLGFTLMRGESQELKSWSRDGKSSVPLFASFSEDGMSVNLCRYKPSASSRQRKYCATLTATTRQLHKGTTQSFNIEKYMHGHLYCALKPDGNRTRTGNIQNLTIKNIFKGDID
ncbi:MAG: hypothetical protein HWE34_02710 [Methylocystaceae bacterium]|nr:hypothetical protein [Methylocystaceae bacterium]